MTDVRFPYVYKDVDRHGNVRIYFWRKGEKKVRIREPLGSAAFVVRYQELIDGGVPPGAPALAGKPTVGTWRWLCGRYFVSEKFRALDAQHKDYSPTNPGGDVQRAHL